MLYRSGTTDREREYYDRQQIQEILIIEDDKDINDLLATALSKAGYRTRQAWSGTEGELLLKLDREAYALVLLDLMLRGFQGRSFWHG